MSRTITHKDALELVRAVVKQNGSNVGAAKHLDISPAYLGEILKGTRAISDNVAKKLGYRRVIAYEKLGG